jgi:hypothetical protein
VLLSDQVCLKNGELDGNRGGSLVQTTPVVNRVGDVVENQLGGGPYDGLATAEEWQ